MHATRDTSDFIKRNLVGGRVMRSVGRLVAEHGEQRFAGRIAGEKEVASSVAAWFDSLVAGTCRESWA
jgi:hypothetical protein